ncbi:MAG: response regulator [Rhodospirillales bacterium]|nr:response regulator [Rhodospirillales bacterium]
MSRAEEIAVHIPLLRRYARALTGNQESGDAFVAAALEAIVAAPDEFPTDVAPRIALYAVFHAVWTSVTVDVPEPPASLGDREEIVKKRLATLTPTSRQALLLTAMEGFSDHQAARIMQLDPEEIPGLVKSAMEEIGRQTTSSVLIIEDEPLIAMDLESIVEELGHSVAAVADTRDSAVKAAKEHRPGLVLADIQLADGSSGIDAVREIIDAFEVPVIFVTAYPERLLTGERPEPTFLITKPFQAETVRAAISQALFFESTA